MKKTMHKILIMIVVFSICFLTGCVDGVLTESQLESLIDGITASTIHGDQYFHQIKTLTNNTMFDEELVFDSYSKLALETKEACKIKGIVFVVRSLQNANLNFKVLLQEELLVEKEYSITVNTNQTVSLFLESSVLLDEFNQLTITINQIFESPDEISYEYAQFAFDSFLIFFKE
jgi:PBP1b-binding outer membrane lipoprotein LpoB